MNTYNIWPMKNDVILFFRLAQCYTVYTCTRTRTPNDIIIIIINVMFDTLHCILLNEYRAREQKSMSKKNERMRKRINPERKSSFLLYILVAILYNTPLSTSSRFIWWAVERYEDI